MLRCDATTLALLHKGTLDTTRSNWTAIESLQRDSYFPSEAEVKAAVEADFGKDDE